MLPGILILTLMGYQFARSLTDPDPIHVLFLGLGMAAMFSLGLAIQRFAEKRRAVANE
jgi:Sec-independent protein secretion pathway component TatC